MLETLKFGEGNWANKTDSTLAYSDQYGNFQAIPFDFTRATTATRVNKAGLIESVNEGIARIDYSDSTQGALLLEPQRTNLVQYSNDYSGSSWVKQGFGTASAPIVTSNFATSPDGTQNADRVIFNINGGIISDDFSQINWVGAILNGDASASVYIKSNTNESYVMSFCTPTGSARQITVTPNWQRFSTFTLGMSQGPTLRIRLRGGAESTSDYADISIYGAQVEQGSYATSYIPTNGATATRNQEICNNATPEINSAEGVLFAEISALSNDGNDKYISLSDGSLSNYVYIRITGVLNQIKMGVIKGASTQASKDFIVSDLTQSNKLAVSYSQDLFKFYVNGTLIFTDTSGDTFSSSTLDRLNFDIGTSGFNKFLGKTSQVQVFNTALTDAQLQTLTTI